MPPIRRGSPVLSYTKQSDGYICYQRTRIEKKPNDDWKLLVHLFMGTCCLAAFLYIISEDIFVPGSKHSNHRSMDRFLRSQQDRIVNLAHTASHKLDEVLHHPSSNPKDELEEMGLPPDQVLPETEGEEVAAEEGVVEEPVQEEERLPEPIEKEE